MNQPSGSEMLGGPLGYLRPSAAADINNLVIKRRQINCAMQIGADLWGSCSMLCDWGWVSWEWAVRHGHREGFDSEGI